MVNQITTSAERIAYLDFENFLLNFRKFALAAVSRTP